MKTANRYNVSHITESLINGQFKQAKAQTQYKCKTNPEKQAYIVGQVVGALVDPDNHNKPDLAVRYLNLFNK